MCKIRISLIILLYLLSPNKSSALDSLKNGSIFSTLVDDVIISSNDFFSFYTEPIRFTSTEWLYAAGLTGGVLLMMSVDQKVTNSVGRNTIKTLNNDFWDIPTRYGFVSYATVFSLTTYFTGLFTGWEKIRTTGRLLIETLFISGSAVIIIRYIAGRVRPYYNQGSWKFLGFQNDNEFQSFPSGHTSVAFALSTILAERINNFWARLGFYGMATLTATARVINNQHFLSDVFVGALLGFGAGMYVINKENERINGESTGSLILSPTFNGISLVFVF